jgi:hypothetical protein
MYEWTDSIEHTLDMIRLNCVNLSEHHKQQYEICKSRSTMNRVPIFLLTSANAYAAIGLDSYLKQQYISDINCGVSVFIALLIVIQAFLQYQTKMENELVKFKEYYLLSTKIFKMLSTPREDRKTDGKMFLDEMFTKYEEMVANSDLIEQFKESLLESPDDLMTEPVIDKGDYNSVCSKLSDHWNILYQPKLYLMKKKNASIIKYLKESWRDAFQKDKDANAKDGDDVEKQASSPEEIELMATKKAEEELMQKNPNYNPFSYEIFNKGFIKEQLAKDQDELNHLRKKVKEQLNGVRASASSRIGMTFS